MLFIVGVLMVLMGVVVIQSLWRTYHGAPYGTADSEK
jgi:hypothetical protein